MNLSSITSRLPQREHPSRSLTYSRTADDIADRQHGTLRSQPTRSQALVERFRADSLLVEFQNGDGDMVSISATSIEYQQVSVKKDGNDEKAWKDFVASIRNELDKLHKNVVKQFFERLTGKESSSGKKAEKTSEGVNDAEIADVPEYWSAESTSLRIFEFSISFSGVSGLSDEEFAKKIRAAIDEGFAQARGMMGDVPGPVNNLVDKTYDLTMKKIDEWITSRAPSSASPNSLSV